MNLVLATVAIWAGVAIAVGIRYRSSEGLARRRIQLVAAALSVGTALAGLLVTARVLFGVPVDLGTPIAAVGLLLPIAIAAGTSKWILGLADRTLLLGLGGAGVTLFVCGLLLLFVAGIGGAPTPQERGSLALALTALSVAALLGFPLWRRVSQATRAITYGDRPAPSEIPKDLAARLTRAAPAEEILTQCAEVLQSGLRLRSIEIWSVDDAKLERAIALPRAYAAEVAADGHGLEALARLGVTGRSWLEVWLPELSGDADRNVRVVPATYASEVLAVVIAERDRSGDPFTPTDDDVMTDVARRLGGLLHSHRLDAELQATLSDLQRHAAELQASRARIVAAADDERRRLERDLHDGAQQHLVALTVQLAVAREVMKEDVEEAERLLVELSAQAREATAQLRSLAHGIYPPILQSSGLEGALPDAAARAAIETQVDLSGVGRYPREIESAIYFCCLEALQNAAKHAGERSRASIHLSEEEGEIRFEVIDDGVGFDPVSMNGGRGFTNMSDRLGAVGGRLDVISQPGAGVRVRGVIPIPPSF
jgi:signal transduction histidine kinase